MPNSRSRSSRPSGSRSSRREVLSRRDARLGRELEPPRRHQVHEDHELAELQREQLPAPLHAREGAALQGVQGRVERLERVDARGQRGLHREAVQGGPQPAGADLHLGQLGHSSTLEWAGHGSVGTAGRRRDRRPRRAGAGGAGRGVLSLGRRARRRGVRGGVRRAAARRGRGRARAVLLGRPRARPAGPRSPARVAAACCCSGTSTRWSRTSATSRCAATASGCVGSGAVDMKGGVVLAIGVFRALAARPADFAEVALLLVCDEEWRTRAVRPRAALRGLGRVPVLRGRRAARRTGTRASSSGARRRARSACARAGAPRTPAPRPTGGATRCSPWPRPPMRSRATTRPTGPTG